MDGASSVSDGELFDMDTYSLSSSKRTETSYFDPPLLKMNSASSSPNTYEDCYGSSRKANENSETGGHSFKSSKIESDKNKTMSKIGHAQLLHEKLVQTRGIENTKLIKKMMEKEAHDKRILNSGFTLIKGSGKKTENEPRSGFGTEIYR
jgi:hypothetical protein